MSEILQYCDILYKKIWSNSKILTSDNNNSDIKYQGFKLLKCSKYSDESTGNEYLKTNYLKIL